MTEMNEQSDGPDWPMTSLRTPEISRFFHHYISELASWYTLSDASRSFSTTVPEIALHEPLLFSAIIALSAMHTCKTTVKSAETVARWHHQNCVRLLIQLDQNHNAELLTNGIALAATCILRSFEILECKQTPSQASCCDILRPNFP